MSQSALPKPLLLPLLLCVAPTAWSATLLSFTTTGAPADAVGLDASTDGRYVVFASATNDVVAGDSNGYSDVFRLDRTTGQVVLVSFGLGGGPGNWHSAAPSVSADGSLVAFQSAASNLVPGDTNDKIDVFVRNMDTGVVVRVSVNQQGVQGNGDSTRPAISRDGQWVAYQSDATNLQIGLVGAVRRVFVHDMQVGATTSASLTDSGDDLDDDATLLGISADGQRVLFATTSTNLDGDTNSGPDVALRDMSAETTTLLSQGPGAPLGANGADDGHLSENGQVAVLRSLLPGGKYAVTRVDVDSGAWDVVSRSTLGATPPSGTVRSPRISPNGRYVGWIADSDFVWPTVAPSVAQAYVRDLVDRTTRVLSVGPSGARADAPALEHRGLVVFDSGSMAFASAATNLGPVGANGVSPAVWVDRPTTESADLLFAGAIDRQVFVAIQSGARTINYEWSSQQPSTNWFARGAADFDQDGSSDVLYQHGPSRLLSIAYMQGPTVLRWNWVSQIPNAGWTAVGVGDFTGDGRASILYQHVSGALTISVLNDNIVERWMNVAQAPNAGWAVAGVADINGDGFADIVFQHQSAYVVTIAYCQGGNVVGWQNLSQNPNPGWVLRAIGEFTGDAYPDLMFQHQSSGALTLATCHGANVQSWSNVDSPGSGYFLLGAGAF